MNVDGLIQSLSQFSPETSGIATTIANSIRPVGYILITFFMCLEILEQQTDLRLEGGVMTPKIFGSIIFNYLLAYILVLNSSAIFDAILTMSNLITSKADSAVAQKDIDTIVELGKIKGWFFKNLLTGIAMFVQYIAEVVTKILLQLRYFQMYIARALAPILVAFFANRSLRPISVTFIKMFAAYALQGLVLLIIIRLYPYIVTDDLLKVSSSGILENVGTALGSITKAVIYIVVLIGSGRYIKSILGVS